MASEEFTAETWRPTVIDLYSGPGGVGYALDGLNVDHLGVDLENFATTYPGAFIQHDASDLEFIRELPSPDLLWMSPPCQAYSTLSHVNKHRFGFEDPRDYYPTFADLNVRDVIEELDPTEYIIENVTTCEELKNPTRLNGLAFGLGFDLERHFETSFPCPDNLGVGEPEEILNTRQGVSQSEARLADAKSVPRTWGKQQIRSAIAPEMVEYLLHYCPSTPDVETPALQRQVMLTEVA